MYAVKASKLCYSIVNMNVFVLWQSVHVVPLSAVFFFSLFQPFCLKGALSRQFCYILVKTAQIFDKEVCFFNMKLLIQHWEENTKVFLSEEQTIVIF